MSTKHVNLASQFNVPSHVYSSLFKAPRVDEELSRAIGTSCTPVHTSDIKKALDALYKSYLVSWRLGWHLTVLSQFLKQQNIEDTVTRAVISHMHSAVQESRKVSATGASTAIAASRCMVLDSPACRGWQALWPRLLSSLYGGTNLFGGSFYTHIDSATRTQEQLAQVRHLTAPRAPTTRAGPSGPPRAGGQPQRWTAPPPAPTSVLGGAAGGPPASKRRCTKSSRGSGRQPSHGTAIGSGVSHKGPQPKLQ